MPLASAPDLLAGPAASHGHVSILERLIVNGIICKSPTVFFESESTGMSVPPQFYEAQPQIYNAQQQYYGGYAPQNVVYQPVQPVGFVDPSLIVQPTATIETKSAEVIQLEEQVKDLQKKLRSTLEYLQDAQVLKPRLVVLVEPETEDVVVRKGHSNQSEIFFSALAAQTVSSETVKVAKLETYEEVFVEPRQLPNGNWVNVELKVPKTRPKVKKTSIPIAKLPKGADITEFVAETGTKLSPDLLNALRRAAEKGPEHIRFAFANAQSAEWGPVTFLSFFFFAISGFLPCRLADGFPFRGEHYRCLLSRLVELEDTAAKLYLCGPCLLNCRGRIALSAPLEHLFCVAILASAAARGETPINP